MLIIAGTGQGKTTLTARLVDYRKRNIVFGTKKADSTYQDFIDRGFKRVQSIDEISHFDKRVLLWPEYRTTIREFKLRQAHEFKRAFDWAAGLGSWTIWNDEELYMCRHLGLTDEVAWVLTQARSSGLTMINGSQRPAWIPLESYNGSTHAFLANSNEAADAKRLADLGAVNSKELIYNMQRLKRYEYVYVNTRTHAQPVIIKVDDERRSLRG